MCASPARFARSLVVPLVWLALVGATPWLGACNDSDSDSGSPTPISSDFRVPHPTGPRPLDVQFVNASTGPATEWLWDFGDGETSTERDPLHRYDDAGTFDVSLTSRGSGGEETVVRQGVVRVTAPPDDVGFEGQTAGTAPVAPWRPFYGPGGEVGHLLLSTLGGGDGGMPSEGQLWCELGAESTSATLPPDGGIGATPLTGAGIRQEFTYPEGRSVLQFDALFVSAEAPNQTEHADWMSIAVSDGTLSSILYERDSSSPVEGTSSLRPGQARTPLEVVSADLAQLFPTSSPTTLFTLTVQLGNGGDDARPSHGYVDNLRFEVPVPPLPAEFVADRLTVESAFPVQFTDQTSPEPTSWSWDFGDGTASSLQNPLHAYDLPGIYDVRLRATAPGGSGEKVRVEYIMVFAPSGTVDFAAKPRTDKPGETVTFTNLSNGSFVDWTWDFGDDRFFVQTNQAGPVLHDYREAGTYSVELTGRFRDNSVVSAFKPDLIEIQDPPTITFPPQDRTVTLGQAATFTVTAEGTALAYEWRRNGAPIAGAPDQPSFTTPPTEPANDGELFDVRVFNAVDSVSSEDALLTVLIPPDILQHPQDQVVCAGAMASFSVNATGIGLGYQWRKNAVDIPGATSSTYSTPPATATDGGALFSVVVSNLAGKVTSDDALLTVTVPPAITEQPQDQDLCLGTAATLSVSATGTSPAFQWRKNGLDIPGATSSSYTTPPISAADDGALFSVVATNSCGSVTSDEATLRAFEPAFITQQPQSQKVCDGAPATFTLTTTGVGVTFQWRKDGLDIPGATTNPYTTPPTSVTDDGAVFSVVLGNPCGSVSSDGATLTVTALPAIAQQPQGLAVCVGSTATFAVSATGVNLGYQWRANGVDIPFATSSTFTTRPIRLTDDGARISVEVSSNCGAVVSNEAILTVLDTALISGQPQRQIVCVDTSATFAVTASGSNLAYQWRRNEVDIPAATSSVYTTPPVGAADDGSSYSVVVSSTCGNVISNEASLTVLASLALTQQPESQRACEGSTVTFSATATGVGLVYQWRRNGADIPGATRSSHAEVAEASDDGARFSVVVSSTCGTLTSDDALLAVLAGPDITRQPEPLGVCVGSTATFAVSATGFNLGYQWRRDGIDIPGATSSSFTTDPTSLADDGARLSVVVSGDCGNVTSSDAILAVTDTARISGQPQRQEVCVNSSATFSVTADGSNLGYQWRRNGVDIPAATNSTYTTPPVGPADDGSLYSVVVTSSCGNVTSADAPLALLASPAITQQPQSQSACEGSSVTFSATATGVGLGFQWQRNGADIPGATSSAYTELVDGSDDGARFSVLVNSSCGTLTSDDALLDVLAGPTITEQPENRGTCVGSTATFTVTAEGADLAYQWRKNGLDIPGATSSSFTTDPASQADDRARLSVVVSGTCGTVLSNDAILIVANTVLITGQPQSQEVCANSSATFFVTADGSNLAYQWRRNGVDIPAATASSYTTPPVGRADDGTLYSVVVTSSCGTVISAEALLEVQVLEISRQPQSQEICSGSQVTFSVTATGVGLEYQWRANGSDILGAISSSYSKPVTAADDNKLFSVRVSSLCGTAISDDALLRVLAPPDITQQPALDTYKVSGSTATFTVQGTPGATFQWRKNGVAIFGAIGSTYTTPPLSDADDGSVYTVSLSNACGSRISSGATLHVAPTWPTIFSNSLSACKSCHTGGADTALFSMADDVIALANLRRSTTLANVCAGSKRINPGDPDDSSLYNTTDPDTLARFTCISRRMGSLTAQQRKEIFDYIKAGAP